MNRQFFRETIAKGFLLLVLLILLGGIGAGCAEQEEQTEATDETNNWQTYDNTKFGYQVKYPENWYFISTGYGPPPPATIMLSNVSEDKMGTSYASFWVSTDAVAEDAIPDNYGEVKSLVSDGYRKSNLTFAGENAIKLERSSQPSDNGASIYVKHSNTMYRILWGATSKDIYHEHKNTLEKILGTFQFTN